jgi:membrane protein YqaA with SNARE-associated domain
MQTLGQGKHPGGSQIDIVRGAGSLERALGRLLRNLFRLLAKLQLWLLVILKPLGLWGAGVLALLDAAAIPLPIDLILAGYIWSDRRRFYLYILAAAAGSALGGLLPYYLGRAGGELLLMKRIDRARMEKLRTRFERQEFFAILIPSMLPPPAPWKLFVIGAGVFEMKPANFLVAVFAGRVLRDLVTALLVIRYGPDIVRIMGSLLARHKTAMAGVTLLLLVLLAGWMLRRVRAKRTDGG